MKIEYKATYFDDLDDIADYITTYFSADLARRIVREIHNKCQALADRPRIGRFYPRNNYFNYYIVKKKNLVFYHIDEQCQTVTLHRIFDSRRDYNEAVSSIPED